MVERPIKKSERQTNAAPSDAVEEVAATELKSAEGSIETTSPGIKEKKIIQPVQRKDKTKGKGKGREIENEPLPVNRALVRGPKPKKAEPAIAQSEEIEPQEITSENASDEVSEPTTAD